jgi:non-lysosomal glucosylceramidase
MVSAKCILTWTGRPLSCVRRSKHFTLNKEDEVVGTVKGPDRQAKGRGMKDKFKVDRRGFLKQAAGALGVAAQSPQWSSAAVAQGALSGEEQAEKRIDPGFPRHFEGRKLGMISFPLGGVAAGSIGLGGCGQLRDWEIFNRPNKGFRPKYAFPSIWAQAGTEKPVARVLESRLLSPYQGQDGLGSDNVPGLSRMESATFAGEYPLAHINFHDGSLPVTVELDAFSPFIPHEPDDSGLPVAILHYRVTNPGKQAAKVGIAFSVDNPIQVSDKRENGPKSPGDKRANEYRLADGLVGLSMTNTGLEPDDPMSGSFVLAAMPDRDAAISHWVGWPEGRWWNSPLFFWDQFSASGNMGAQPEPHNHVGTLCLQRAIGPGQSASFRFLLGWHFANRTPEWCGWDAPQGEGKTIIGNYYSTRFSDAWQAVTYAAKNLKSLETRTQMFVATLRNSTLPSVVKEAASANLSTLATTTCFRTADGEFHAFEGSDDSSGCCFGNCTHVWNYETVTPFLFPTFARSLRKSAFGYSMDDAGGLRFRQLLPEGKARFGYAAADGQMGQIIHAWLDWKLSGDRAWLRGMWPKVKKALEFAWVPGGWDANRDGVLKGVQHNTYDVEFYGPNPMCGIYYLGALRAGEEMARAADDASSASEYRRLFEKGQQWIDANLFNGEFYVQRIKGFRKEEIAPNLRSDMGTENTENPEYQVGSGCLVDQLVGQYLADVGNLGALVSPDHIRKTLASIHRYNYKRTLGTHDNVARTYALNGESAVVVCDYGKAERPRIPFPYFSEAWTGLEYTIASLMMSWGMVDEGVEYVRNTRLRYDGEKRNPWDEAECGHHYARAMSSWSAIGALSGFYYDGATASVIAVPRIAHDNFNCFWATGTAWGTFSYRKSTKGTRFVLKALAGKLDCHTCEISAAGQAISVFTSGSLLAHRVEKRGKQLQVSLDKAISLTERSEFQIDVQA